MTESERKMMYANIKLQDENNDLRFVNTRYCEILDNIKTYITINKDENGKINADNIIEIIGDYNEK